MEGRVDFRVWQYDPDIDGVLHLLRQVHAAVTMRFHACIFSLSQSVPVVGIDYYETVGGKVGELFRDLGRGQDTRRIDEVECGWLVERLLQLAKD